MVISRKLFIFLAWAFFSLNASAFTQEQVENFVFLFGNEQESAEKFEYLIHHPQEAKECTKEMLEKRLMSALNHKGENSDLRQKLESAAKVVEMMFGE